MLCAAVWLGLWIAPGGTIGQGVAVTMSGGGKEPPAATVGGGVITGRVMFADTNGPARFSKVLLKATTPSTEENPFAALLNGAQEKNSSKAKLSAEDQAEMKKQQAASMKLMSAVTDLMISATVAADGSYSFTNVRPGSYYVHAVAPGYIDPLAAFSSDDLTSTDTAMKQKIAAVATVVTVSGTDQAKADLRLERGASISGRVLYDDGTPAVGWTVRVVHPAPADASGGAFAAMGLDASDIDLAHATEASTTDDTGHFRIAGLQTGSYLLQARLTTAALGHSSFNPVASNAGSPFSGNAMAGMMGLRLTVYSGNAMRQSEAKTLELRTGEERSGYELTVPLHLMHSVGGVVRSKADGHPVSGGRVELTAQDANGKDDATLHLTATVQSDGSFRFDYVPGPATYTVKVSHAVDASTVSTKQVFGSLIAEQKTSHSYGPVSMTAAMGDTDLLGLKLDVPETAVDGK